MAKVTFLIGNGFDLACGLRSRYLDSYDSYIHSESKDAVINEFKNAIENDISTWGDFEMRLADYAKQLNSSAELIACLRDYTQFLSDYLMKEQQNFWNKNETLIETNNEILKEMGRSLTAFFNLPSQNDVNEIDAVLRRDPKMYYSFISFNYTNIFDRLLHAAHINGNIYMGVTVDPAFKIVHIHGLLGEAVTLGLDNEDQVSETPYHLDHRSRRTLIKPAFLNSYDYNRVEMAKELIMESDIICTYGLSLGDSDLTWRKQLASWLQSGDSHHLVYYNYNYMNKKYHSTAITEKMDDEEDCKEAFFPVLFSETPVLQNKEELVRKIHIPVGASIFNIEQAINKEVELAQKREAIKSRLE